MRLKNKWTIQILIVDTALINSYIAWTQLSWMRLGIFSWGLPVCMLSCVWLIVTPCTVAHVTVALQAPLSMGFSRQEYWDGLPCPPPGDLPDPGIDPTSPTLAGRFITTEPPGKPWGKQWEIKSLLLKYEFSNQSEQGNYWNKLSNWPVKQGTSDTSKDSESLWELISIPSDLWGREGLPGFECRPYFAPRQPVRPQADLPSLS